MELPADLKSGLDRLNDASPDDKYGLGINSKDFISFLEEFQEVRPKNALFDPKKLKLSLNPNSCELQSVYYEDSEKNNLRPGLGIDYNSLHGCLSDFSENPNHRVVFEIGSRLADDYGYHEADGSMFAWGYNLYFGIMNRKNPEAMPHYFSDEVMDEIDYGQTEEIIERLASVAEAQLELLSGGAELLLDEILKVHTALEFIDDGMNGDFENREIRKERLRLVLAGMGLAYKQWRHGLDSLCQDATPRSSKNPTLFKRIESGKLIMALMFLDSLIRPIK